MGKRVGLKLLVIGSLCVLVVLAGLGARSWLGARQSGPSGDQGAAARQAVLYDAGEFVTNLADTSVRRFIKVHVQLQLADGSVTGELERHQVSVRDCVLGVLRSRTFVEVSGERGMDELGQEVVGRLNQLLGEGRILGIYFTEFVVQ
ncbi:MAG: flagellar basal body-associated FliL family protein [Acetobacteraceae bacterium]|nr:flagellar basal body-associated FliL family protein [Acetobacteraceae bacterium]